MSGLCSSPAALTTRLGGCYNPFMPQLGVNIDHVATVRQARRTYEPDPVWAAALAEMGGADGITLHLREDRRHISDRDLRVLRETVTVKLNLEMACEPEILADRLRGETRSGDPGAGKDGRRSPPKAGWTFAASATGWPGRSTGCARPASRSACFSIPIRGRSKRRPGWRPTRWNCTPANTPWPPSGPAQEKELDNLRKVGALVRQAGLTLHAGHGLTYRNVRPIAAIEGMHELNIGHSIVARAIMVGFAGGGAGNEAVLRLGLRLVAEANP